MSNKADKKYAARVRQSARDAKEARLDALRANLLLVSSAADLVALLPREEGPLPVQLETRILAKGQEALEPLHQVLRDEYRLLREGKDGLAYAASHAAELLGQLKSPDSIPVLLTGLDEIDVGDRLFYHLEQALIAIGPPVAEPILQKLSGDVSVRKRSIFCSVLSRLGLQDERIYQELWTQVHLEPDFAPGFLAKYGDPRAIQPMLEMIEALPYETDLKNFRSAGKFIELRAAVLALGGTLSEALQQKVEGAIQIQKATFDQMTTALRQHVAAQGKKLPSAPAKPSRNDPCWCGSGQKYKKCHLAHDENR